MIDVVIRMEFANICIDIALYEVISLRNIMVIKSELRIICTSKFE